MVDRAGLHPVPATPQLNTVKEVIKSIGATVEFVNPISLAEKVKKTAQFMMQFHDRSKDPQSNFTWAEVAKYDGEQTDLIYIVINQFVYDLTEIIQWHPGGPAPIKDHAGQDATAAVKVMNVDLFEPFLHLFQVGRVIEEDSNSTLQYIWENSIKNRL
ncbi:cytochrome b5-like heme/Steroid binding domain-containing protein [Phthorimaea operculella]|nr:cytochrome b5-like heme/Steroid binding domain-containing protein [Phthorimaea operculella]